MINRVGSETYWRDRAVLVTGATGLLGGWVVKALLARGANVTCLVRDWVPSAELIRAGLDRQVAIVRGDVRDQACLERCLGEYEIGTVLHLAAQTIVPIANRNPVSTFETNIAGTWIMLEACRRSPKVDAVVVASSDKAYGSARTLPYVEMTPLAGEHPYDVSKSCADLIAASYARSWGLRVGITRCGNFFGGGDLNWNRLVPGTIRSLLRGERPIVRSDGLYVRDYIYIEDAADAYLLLAQALHEDPKLGGEAFNFSTEKPRTVLEMIAAIGAAMGSELKPVVLDEAGNEIREQYLDAGKARTRLGWEPAFTLEEGLQRTAAWYRDFLQISHG
jgi:CDP-glucose 4,6-dehydratase